MSSASVPPAGYTLEEQWADQLLLVRQRHMALMGKTLATLQSIFAAADPAAVVTLRDPNDGARGWTPLEVLCHLRDYDVIFLARAQMMVEQETPSLPGYDHEQLAVARAYNRQSVDKVLTELSRSRGATLQFYADLTADQWRRSGVHPERGRFTMTDAVMQVGLHDVTHLEQIVRTLASAA